MEIEGKVAVVTGAAAGIGRATAEALAAAGAKVVVADLDPGGAAAVVAGIRANGGSAVAVTADVATPGGVRAVFDTAESEFGGVDIVHNNAGVVSGEPPWPDTPLEKLASLVAVNLGGVAMGTAEGIRRLRQRGGGVIVETASVAALAPMPTDPVYSATKAGVVRIVESCAGLAAEGIRVNAVLPGVVDTDMTMRHTGDGTRPARWLEPLLANISLLQPADVASAVLDLVRNDGAAGELRVVPNPS